MMDEIAVELSVTAASGIEAVTKRELKHLGFDPGGAVYGRIPVQASLSDIARLNLHLRTADRVFLTIAEFSCQSFDELFDGVYAAEWERFLPADAALPVEVQTIKSKLYAHAAIASVAKKAVLQKMTDRKKAVVFPETGAVFRLRIALIEDVATVLLDTTGAGLHKRGYRTMVGEAPIAENLAAAMLLLSDWTRERALIDPFAGSGTLPIEAAMIASDTAPGLFRSFAFEGFGWLSDAYRRQKEQALDGIDRSCKARIQGFDINPKAISLAVRHAEAAGVRHLIHFGTQDMREVSSRYRGGTVVTNPPYGERLLKEPELQTLYRDFGKMMRRLDDWSLFVITPYPRFERYFGKKADKTRKLYNAQLECRYYCYYRKGE